MAVEFRDSPPQGFVVSGGTLALPDSSGVFPERMQRHHPVTGRVPGPGRAAGPLLVFTDLEPGTYRIGVFTFEQSATMRRLMPKKPAEPLEDYCNVYRDSIPQLTFTIGPGEARYLGVVVRRTRLSLDGGSEVWASGNTWAPGDTARAWKAILKRKAFAPWHDLVAAADRRPGTKR